jgi:hypothetical protein
MGFSVAFNRDIFIFTFVPSLTAAQVIPFQIFQHVFFLQICTVVLFLFCFFIWFVRLLHCGHPGLFCQPRVIVKMIVEKQMECRLTGETEVLGENLPQRHSCPSQNPT